MPNQFFSPEGDLEEHFITDYWLIDQYVGDTLWGVGLYTGDNSTNITRSTARQEHTQNTTWKQVSAGYKYSAAVRTDGTLWTWGFGAGGQIGDGSVFARSTPRQISIAAAEGLTGWSYVACGGEPKSGNGIVLAIRTNGTLWAWGGNYFGQIGDNTWSNLTLGANYRSTPRQISAGANGITGWKQVSSGSYHTAAIRNDGTLWCWGRNNFGQLGDNTIANRSTPRQISAGANRITDWKQVDCGAYYTAAIRNDGTLWSWGRNNIGQIGDNTTEAGVSGANARSTPRQEFTLSANWKQVSAGYSTTLAVKTNGTLWGWGENYSANIGDNTRVRRSTPRQEFTSSTNWKQCATGVDHSLAIKAGVELN